jgi:hypothetical protein
MEGFTWSGLEPTIYHTQGEHDNHYTTDVVIIYCYRLKIQHRLKKNLKIKKQIVRHVYPQTVVSVS